MHVHLDPGHQIDDLTTVGDTHITTRPDMHVCTHHDIWHPDYDTPHVRPVMQPCGKSGSPDSDSGPSLSFLKASGPLKAVAHNSPAQHADPFCHEVSQPDQILSSDTFAFRAHDQHTGMLADLFPAAYDVLALQQVFPTVSMHAHANWICQNIPVREYSGIHQLRGILKEAMHVYIYTDGSVPATDREDQAPAFALVIFFENAHGDLFTLGHLGAQLRHSGSLF